MAIISSDLPYPEIEFRIPEEARIVGVVDLEIRPLSTALLPSVAKALRRQWKPEVLAPEPSRLGQLLQTSRLRIGLSFRAAAQMSRELATLMGDDRYFTAPGSLSDYETLNSPPRHFHKIVTFCAVYRLSLNAIFQTLGLSLEDARSKPIPDLLTHESATIDIPAQAEFVADSGLVADLVVQLGGIPFFLRGALPALCELPRPSLNDIYWIGGTREPVHPFLAGGVLAVVNRQRKRPNGCGSKPLWQQPLYILLQRDGTHLCGCCNRENNSLVVHTYPGGTHKRVQVRGPDAEVIGKVVLVLRRLA
jgi:hypothetical protein